MYASAETCSDRLINECYIWYFGPEAFCFKVDVVVAWAGSVVGNLKGLFRKKFAKNKLAPGPPLSQTMTGAFSSSAEYIQ